VYAAAECVF